MLVAMMSMMLLTKMMMIVIRITGITITMMTTTKVIATMTVVLVISSIVLINDHDNLRSRVTDDPINFETFQEIFLRLNNYLFFKSFCRLLFSGFNALLLYKTTVCVLSAHCMRAIVH